MRIKRIDNDFLLRMYREIQKLKKSGLNTHGLIAIILKIY